LTTNEVTSISLQESKNPLNVINIGITSLNVFEEKYFYWRQFVKEGNEFYFPIASCIYFEAIEDICEMSFKARLSKKDIYALYPD
jgi:hypothetical protein